jgi:predicted PurR-regulated permease PerM
LSTSPPPQEAPEPAGPGGRTRDEWHWAYAGLVLLCGTFLFWTLRPALSPVLVFLLFLILTSPYAGTRQHRVIIIASSIAFGVWALRTLGGLLTPFLVAIGIAYILNPAVARLQSRGMSRGLAILCLAIPVLGLLAIFTFAGIPAIARQVGELIDGLPGAMDRLATWLERMRQTLLRLDLPFIAEERLYSSIRSLDQARITAFLQERQQQLLSRGWGAVLGVGRGVGVVLTILGYFVLTPVLLFYLLRDWDKITTAVAELIPAPKREESVRFFREFDRLLSRFLRGQLISATLVGILTWIGLLIAGFPYPGLVGAIAGVFNLVPYLGLIVSVIPVFIIALMSGAFLSSLIRAGIVFGIIQFIDGSITGPRITGQSVGLHPVWVILALGIGGFAFGFVGLLLAMPTAVIIKLVIREALERYKASRVYRGGTIAES